MRWECLARGPRPRRAGTTVANRNYFNEVKSKSQFPSFQMSETPATSLASTFGWLSHSSGIATAWLTSRLSTLAQACARAVGSTTSAALAIAALICGLLTWPQLELLVGTIAGP